MATKASTVIRELLFTSGLKKFVSHEGALNSRAGTDAQADEGLSSVFRVSVKTTYVLHSLTQGVLSRQLGTRAGTSTRIPEVRVG